MSYLILTHHHSTAISSCQDVLAYRFYFCIIFIELAALNVPFKQPENEILCLVHPYQLIGREKGKSIGTPGWFAFERAM